MMFAADGSLGLDTFSTTMNHFDWQPYSGQPGLSGGLADYDNSSMTTQDIQSLENHFPSQGTAVSAQVHSNDSFPPPKDWAQTASVPWQQNEISAQPLTPYKTASAVPFWTQPRGHYHRRQQQLPPALHSDFLSLGGCPSPPLSPTARPSRPAQCRSGAQYNLHPGPMALQNHHSQMLSSSSRLSEFDSAALLGPNQQPQFFRRPRSSASRNRPIAGATKSAFSGDHAISRSRGVSVSPVKAWRHGGGNGNNRLRSSSLSPRKRTGAKAFAAARSVATSSSSSRGMIPPPPPPPLFPQPSSTSVENLDSSSFPPLSACEEAGSGVFGTPVSSLTRDLHQTLLQPAPEFPIELSCASSSSLLRRAGAPQDLQLASAKVDIPLPQPSATTLDKFDFGFLDADPFGGAAVATNNASEEATTTTLTQLDMTGAGVSAGTESGIDPFDGIFLSSSITPTTEEAAMTKHDQSQDTNAEEESHEFDAMFSFDGEGILGSFDFLGSAEDEGSHEQNAGLEKIKSTSDMTEQLGRLSGTVDCGLQGLNPCASETEPLELEADKIEFGCGDFTAPSALSGEWFHHIEAVDMAAHDLPLRFHPPDALLYDQNADEHWINSTGDPDSLFFPSAFSPTPSLPPPPPLPPVPASPPHHLRSTTACEKDYRSRSLPRATTDDHDHNSGYPRRRRTATSTSPSKSKSRANSSTSARSTASSADGAFVNYTSLDAPKIMRSVAPSGSSKTKAKREAAAAAEKRAWQEAVVRAVRAAGGDVEAIMQAENGGDDDGVGGEAEGTKQGERFNEVV